MAKQPQGHWRVVRAQKNGKILPGWFANFSKHTSILGPIGDTKEEAEQWLDAYKRYKKQFSNEHRQPKEVTAVEPEA